MQNEFSRDEVELISKEIIDYRDNPPPNCPFNIPALQRISNTVLQKLYRITPMTMFTKQDYTIMALSLKNLLDAIDASANLRSTDELLRLCNRLMDKIE